MKFYHLIFLLLFISCQKINDKEKKVESLDSIPSLFNKTRIETGPIFFKQKDCIRDFSELKVNGLPFANLINNQLIDFFGKPDSIVKKFDEILDNQVDFWYYSQNSIVILNNKIIEFTLFNDNWVFEPYNLKVGMKKDVLESKDSCFKNLSNDCAKSIYFKGIDFWVDLYIEDGILRRIESYTPS